VENLTRQVREIFNQWKSLRKKCGYDPSLRMTAKIEQKILRAVKKFGKDRVLLVIKYISESEDNYSQFMRGSSGVSYTTLDNLFRERKFDDKYDRAVNWQKHNKASEISEVYIPYMIVEANDDCV